MIRRRLTPAVVSSALAITISAVFPHGAWWWAAAVPLMVVSAALGIVAARHGPPRLLTLCVSICLGAALGSFCLARMGATRAAAFLPVPPSNVTSFTGTLTQDSSLSTTGRTILRLRLSAVTSALLGRGGEARGAVIVLVNGDHRYSLGARISVHAALTPTDAAETGPEAFITFVDLSRITFRGYVNRVAAWRSQARDWLHRAVAGAGYPASALLEALMIGGREDVPAELYDGFRLTGSLHILALSGMHVTVLYGIVVGALSFMFRRRFRRLTFALAVAVLLLYQVLAGFMPSLLRATVMIIVGGLGMLADRDPEPLNLLGLAGIIILLMDPFQVFSLSFQLSFAAIAGMCTVGTLVNRLGAGRVPPIILLPLGMSVGAQVATLPLVVAQFGVYYPSGILAGLLLVPLTTAFLWAGLAWLPLSVIPLPVVHTVCAQVFAVFYQLIDGVAALFSRVPGLPLPTTAALTLPLAAAAILLVFLLPLRRTALCRTPPRRHSLISGPASPRRASIQAGPA